jgi:hypothetical protein
MTGIQSLSFSPDSASILITYPWTPSCLSLSFQNHWNFWKDELTLPYVSAALSHSTTSPSPPSQTTLAKVPKSPLISKSNWNVSVFTCHSPLCPWIPIFVMGVVSVSTCPWKIFLFFYLLFL